MYKRENSLLFLFVMFKRFLTEKGTFEHISGVITAPTTVSFKNWCLNQTFLSAWKAISKFSKIFLNIEDAPGNPQKISPIIRYFLNSIWKSDKSPMVYVSSKLVLTIPPASDIIISNYKTFTSAIKNITNSQEKKIVKNMIKFSKHFWNTWKFPTSTHIFNLWKCTKIRYFFSFMRCVFFFISFQMTSSRDLETNTSGEISSPRSVLWWMLTNIIRKFKIIMCYI